MTQLICLLLFAASLSIDTAHPHNVSPITIDSVFKYEPNWDSLDTRPLPPWFDEAKIGIFLHWGVFSVPSFQSEWFWMDWKAGNKDVIKFMSDNYPKQFTYQDFAKEFTAEFFDPQEWAELFQNSGARYVVLTSKHHEGYTMWPSNYSFSWNAKDVGPNRDLVGELAEAVRNKNLIFGLYHSLFEWFNPMYLADKANLFLTQDFVDHKCMPEMKELVEKYKPEIIWSDGDWESFDTYWKSTEFLAWLYNDSPVKDTVVVNDRWGIGCPMKHGDFYSGQDRYNPGVLLKHKWENAMTVDKSSWGFRRNAKLSDFLTIEELLYQLASTISCGGNILINVGPTKDGMIAPIFQERLTQLGKWLSVNQEGVYATKPWIYQNDTITNGVWYTCTDDAVYAYVLQWPLDNILSLGAPLNLVKDSNGTTVSLLGYNGTLKWTLDKEMKIFFPDKASVLSDYAWVLKIVIPDKWVN